MLFVGGSAFAKTFYVDSQSGSDNNSGMAVSKAWKSLAKASSAKYSANDRLLLRRGCVFAGKIRLEAIVGGRERYVIVGGYDGGDHNLAFPVIDARGFVAGVELIDCEYVRIDGIEIMADAGAAKEQGAKTERFGVLVSCGEIKNSRGIELKNLKIHDVFATESVDCNGRNATSNMGMGIRFTATGDSFFSDVVVDNCRIERTGHTGIKIGCSAEDTENFCSNIQILNNSLKDIGGPGIQPGRCKGVLVRGNVVDASGSSVDKRMHGRGSGIWPWTCNDVLIEKNKFMHARGKMDSCGAHIDFNCNDVVAQYNLSVDNEGGFVQILGNNRNCSYRYNISINDGARVKGKNGAFADGRVLRISGYVGKHNKRIGPFNSYIYNNTVYVKETISSCFGVASTTDGLLVANNIFYLLGDTRNAVEWEDKKGVKAKNILFENNLYINASVLPERLAIDDSRKLIGDPGFRAPGGFDPCDYIPGNDKAVRDKGIPIRKLDGDKIGLKVGLDVKKDFFGNDIVAGPDLGAIEIKGSSKIKVPVTK